MTVADRIRTERERQGLTQEELATKMGYASKSAVSRTENAGDNIGQKRIKEFAKALNVSIAYIMGWEEEEKEVPQYNPKIQEFIEILPKLTNEQIDSLIHTAELFVSMNDVR